MSCPDTEQKKGSSPMNSIHARRSTMKRRSLSLPRTWLIAMSLASGFVAPAHAASIGIEHSAGLGEFRSIVATSSSTVFAGSRGGGLWRSIDVGLNWSRVAQFPANYIWQIARDPVSTNRVYVATDDGVFRSIDGGATWLKILGSPARAIAVSPSGATLLVGVTGVGVLRSVNGGDTFARSSAGLDSASITSFAFNTSTDVYVAASANLTVINPITYETAPSPWGGVFRSTDGGQTWVNVTQPVRGTALGSRYIVSLAVTSTGLLFAASREPTGAGSGRIHRFDGTNWFNPADNDQASGHIYDIESLHTDVNEGTRLWAGTRSLGPFRSTDGGFTWVRFQNVLADPALLTGVQAFGSIPGVPSRMLMAPRGLGLFRVESAATVQPSAAVWSRVAGIAADRVLALGQTATAGAHLAGYVGAGAWWLYPAQSPTLVAAYWGLDPVDIGGGNFAPSMVDVAMFGFDGSSALSLFAEAGGVHTYNGGTGTWSKLAFVPGASPTPRGLAFNTAGTLFSVDHYRGLQKYSTGAGWQPIFAGWSGSTGLGRMQRSSFVPSRMYLLQYDALYPGGSGAAPGFFSTDSGGTWASMSAANTGFARLGLKDLAEVSANVLLGVTNKGLYRSSDSGLNWNIVNTVGLEERHLRSIVARAGVAWAVSAGNSVYCSMDSGTTWQKTLINSRARVVRLASIPDGLFALTDGAGIQTISGACP